MFFQIPIFLQKIFSFLETLIKNCALTSKMVKSISVIAPVKDEQENISLVYKEVSTILKNLKMDYEIIFVNDGSTDNSLKEMILVKSKDSKVKVIDLRKNFGQSSAMQAGIDLASKDLVCYIDADLQIDFSELPLFLKEIDKGFDGVIGWRHKRKDSFFKNFASRIAWTFRQKLIGANMHDSGCPFKVFTKEAAKDLELYGEMHRYVPALLRWRGFNLSEVKITHKARQFGTTKYNYKRIYKGLLDLIMVWFWQKYSHRPMHLLGGIGFISISLSFLLGFILIILRLMGKISLTNSSFPLFAYTLFITGVILFCFGIITDILVRTNLKVSNRKNYSVRRIYK